MPIKEQLGWRETSQKVKHFLPPHPFHPNSYGSTSVLQAHILYFLFPRWQSDGQWGVMVSPWQLLSTAPSSSQFSSSPAWPPQGCQGICPGTCSTSCPLPALTWVLIGPVLTLFPHLSLPGQRFAPSAGPS